MDSYRSWLFHSSQWVPFRLRTTKCSNVPKTQHNKKFKLNTIDPRLSTHLDVMGIALAILPRLQHGVESPVRVIELTPLQVQEQSSEWLLECETSVVISDNAWRHTNNPVWLNASGQEKRKIVTSNCYVTLLRLIKTVKINVKRKTVAQRPSPSSSTRDCLSFAHNMLLSRDVYFSANHIKARKKTSGCVSSDVTHHAHEPTEGESGVGVVGPVVELGYLGVVPVLVSCLEVVGALRVEGPDRLRHEKEIASWMPFQSRSIVCVFSPRKRRHRTLYRWQQKLRATGKVMAIEWIGINAEKFRLSSQADLTTEIASRLARSIVSDRVFSPRKRRHKTLCRWK